MTHLEEAEVIFARKDAQSQLSFLSADTQMSLNQQSSPSLLHPAETEPHGAAPVCPSRGWGLRSSRLLSLSCFPRCTVSFLTACLLYSRLVLNLQKFIRYKLLLPSYSFIAPRCTESSFSPPPLLFLSGFLFGCFYDSRLWILPKRPHRSSRPAPSACC